MKILICSDSHGDNESLMKIAKKHPDCDLYIHAGDSESVSYMIRPFDSCKGNCDYFSDFVERRMFDTPYGKLLVQHTPNLQNSLIREYNIRILIHGHTHRRRLEEVDGLVIVNPGSVSYPRDGNDKSYAIMELDQNKYEVKFYHL